VKPGVLALQGAFREHVEALGALGLDAIEVREPEQLATVDVLFLPGGESTTLGRLLLTSGLLAPLAQRLTAGLPVFGTCAGLILLATEVTDGRPDQVSFGALDCTVRRNGYGRQRDSFEAPLTFDQPVGVAGRFPGVFIRAPLIERTGEAIEVLARHEDHPVLVRQGAVWASTFHPELAGDLRLHQRFISEVTS